MRLVASRQLLKGLDSTAAASCATTEWKRWICIDLQLASLSQKTLNAFLSCALSFFCPVDQLLACMQCMAHKLICDEISVFFILL